MRDPLSKLERALPSRANPKPQRVNPRNHDVDTLRRLAWRHQGVRTIAVDQVQDDLIRRILEEMGTELYGPRR